MTEQADKKKLTGFLKAYYSLTREEVAEGEAYAARQHALAADQIIASMGGYDEVSQREAIAEALTAIALHVTEPAAPPAPSQMDLARAWAEGVAWAGSGSAHDTDWYVDGEGGHLNPYLTGRGGIKIGGTDDE